MVHIYFQFVQKKINVGVVAFFKKSRGSIYQEKKSKQNFSNELVLSQVHPLDNVATIVKNAFNILRVNRRRKMRIAIVLVGAGRGRNLYLI